MINAVSAQYVQGMYKYRILDVQETVSSLPSCKAIIDSLCLIASPPIFLPPSSSSPFLPPSFPISSLLSSFLSSFSQL